MQANNLVGQPRETNNSKKMVFIISIYVFLIMTTRYSPADANINTLFIHEKLALPSPDISLAETLNIFSYQTIYEGTWIKQTSNNKYPLTNKQGKFRMYLDRQSTFTPTYLYRIELQMLNGEYIDNGALFYDIYLDNNTFNFNKESESQATVYYNQTNPSQLRSIYRLDEILLTKEEGLVNITAFNFTFTKGNDNQLKVSISIKALETILKFQSIVPQNKATATMIFAAVMLVSSFLCFSAVMKILKDIMELRDNPCKYSFFTVMITNMWDTVLCIVCFIYAFKDQESLMLFIIPAFLLCLLFTNLQPRLMIFIFQSFTDNNVNIRRMLCRFNLFHYGSLFSIYPILMLTNLNWVLFIGMSCMLFPQIYANGFINIRPDIASPYYLKYILSRFFLILYLKANPYNIFGLQPDYILCVLCILLIGIQYGLLFLQQIYGNKKVMPSFLLEPVFDYKLEEEFNIEEGGQGPDCSICLTPLHIDPPQNPGDLEHEPKFKLMKTPCNHHYHSHCLMVWMKIKMQCPQCRCKLPPYE